ncbi:DNA methylase, partial [Salmonella enterica subsp. enterica serovar Halle]|nr:DNA methylase [Salmonella enterica subsp. enterica serovar Halle]
MRYESVCSGIGRRIAAVLPVEKSVPRTWRRPFLKWA